MHGYVVPSRIGTLACTTLQLESSVYSGKKNDVKKYVKNLELINKDKKKKGFQLRGNTASVRIWTSSNCIPTYYYTSLLNIYFLPYAFSLFIHLII